MTLVALQAFHLTFDWKRRVERHVRGETGGAPSPINDAVYWFVDEYDGTFSMHFDETDVEFDLELDLPVIFKSLPEELEGLKRDEGVPHYFSFANQATSLVVELVRSEQQVTLKIKPFLDPPEYFHQFFDDEYRVGLAEFISEWVRFISAVLEAIFEHDASLRENPEMKSYVERVEALRSLRSIPTGS